MEVLALKPTIKLLQHFGLDAHFYELHVGIDNAANGHGAKAREAVEWYLDQARPRRRCRSTEAVEAHLEWLCGLRLHRNARAGSARLAATVRQRATHAARQIVELIMSKKPYGSLNHGERRLRANLINDLFEDPKAFMQALIRSNYIVPGSVANSSFFRAISFDGPMYKVFNDDEIRLWEEWVESLAEETSPPKPETDPAMLMAKCIDALRTRQIGTPGHSANQLSGPDPTHPGRTINQPVAAWSQAPTRVFMSVLSDPANGWIVKNSATDSRFITELLGTDNPMSRAFAGSGGLATGNKPWKQIAEEWIDKGCPLPPPAPHQAQAVFARSTSQVGPHIRGRLTLTSSEPEVRGHPRGRVLGMGVVH
jgi:hypothetical protein